MTAALSHVCVCVCVCVCWGGGGGDDSSFDWLVSFPCRTAKPSQEDSTGGQLEDGWLPRQKAPTCELQPVVVYTTSAYYQPSR